MTMIIALGNARNAMLVSDRRLTMPDGSFDDESNKAFLLITRDARVAIGFSGLAAVPSLGFRTRFWLPETVAQIAATDHSLDRILNRLKERAEQDISPFCVTSKLLNITGVGYQYTDEASRLIAFRLSNFESADLQPVTSNQAAKKFTRWTGLSAYNIASAHLAIISGWNVGPDRVIAPWEEINEWLRIDKPPAAIVSRTVRMIRLMSAAKETHGQVGRECMSVTIPSDPAESPVSEYHSSKAKISNYMPGYIEARGGEYVSYAIADSEMGIADVSGKRLPSSVAQVPRNRPCPCGSERKYKYCHGRKDTVIRLGGE